MDHQFPKKLAQRDILVDGTTNELPIIKRRVRAIDPPIFGTGLRLGIYQGPILCGDRIAIQYNVRQLRTWALKCKNEGCHILAVGELFLCGYNIRPLDKPNVIVTIHEVEELIQPIAIEYNIALLVPYAEKENDIDGDGTTKMYDSMILIDANGSTVRNYRKTQLWGNDERAVWHYPYTKNPNEAYETCTVNGITIGLLNCYEAEFPELCRIYALKGVQVLLIPTAADVGTYNSETKEWSNWAYPDVSRTCITTNAYQNRMFVAYINHSLYQFRSDGTTLSGIYLGNSTVADPTGQTMVVADNVETMLIVDCIPNDYPPVHPNGQSNFFQDRRPELFQPLVAMSYIQQQQEATTPNDTTTTTHPATMVPYPTDPNNP